MSLADRYELKDPVGKGGMGTVYRAYDTVLDREVAIKFLREDMASDPATVERFRREARIAASLSHPAICAVYDFAQDDGKYFIVMELLEGRDLHQMVSQDGALSTDQAVTLFSQVADGLEAAHRAGAVHRDVKPGNIFVTTEGSVKITDFGIATATGQSNLTGTGAILGTPHYLSPEQIDGQVATARSDIYALGCVMFHALTGRPPYEAETSMAVAMSHKEQPPPSPQLDRPELPDDLDRIVTKAMAKSPGQRYASAGQLAAELRRAGGEATVPLATAPATQILEPLIPDKRTRKPLLAIAIIVVALVLLAAMARSCDRTGAPSAAPRLVGLTLSEATSAAEKEGFRVTETRRTDAAAAGTVIDQSPQPGQPLAEGGAIALMVSSGGAAVPDVKGEAEDEAVRQLSAAGLKPEIAGTAEGGQAGTVAAQDPPGGAIVAPGTVVKLTIFQEEEDERRGKGKGDKDDD